MVRPPEDKKEEPSAPAPSSPSIDAFPSPNARPHRLSFTGLGPASCLLDSDAIEDSERLLQSEHGDSVVSGGPAVTPGMSRRRQRKQKQKRRNSGANGLNIEAEKARCVIGWSVICCRVIGWSAKRVRRKGRAETLIVLCI